MECGRQKFLKQRTAFNDIINFSKKKSVDKTRLVAAWLKFKYIQICAFS
jgi:hypothetical protein